MIVFVNFYGVNKFVLVYLKLLMWCESVYKIFEKLRIGF